MKQTGILTFQFADNYGAVLQAYALKSILKEKETTVDIINYLPNDVWDYYSVNPFVCIVKRKFKRLIGIPLKMCQHLKFQKFRIQHLNLGEKIYCLTSDSVNKYDAIIVGSDQVWSDSIIPDVGVYFLDKISCPKKMSYAASFGTNNVSDKVKDYIKTALKDFDMISVREKSGAEIISKIIDKKVDNVSDPVFLLNKNQWTDLYKSKNRISINKDYILYVDLKNDSVLADKATSLSHKTGLPVFSIHPTCRKMGGKSFKQRYDIGPLEYLYLIDNAAYIVTNSFHAIAFSCIFEKKVIHYSNTFLKIRVNDLLEILEARKDNDIIDFSLSHVKNNKKIFQQKSREYVDLLVSHIKG